MTVSDLLQKHEGVRLRPYADSRGYQTIGVGHCIDPGVPGCSPLDPSLYEDDGSISPATCGELLEEDIANVTSQCAATFPWFSGLDPVRQAVVIDLGFNVGVAKFATWRHTVGFLASGDYVSAANELASTQPWATQVGPRAVEDAAMLRSGIWPADGPT